MNRLKIVWLARLIMLPAGAGARLGETRKRIVERLGQPIWCDVDPSGTNEYCEFRAGAFAITVNFSNRVSVKEGYMSTNQVPLGDDDIETLLNLQAGTSTWYAVLPQKVYRRADRGAWAITSLHQLTISFFSESAWG